MKKILMSAFLMTVSLQLMASGFECWDTDNYRVKIYNFIHAKDGTRLPGVFVLSHADMKTLIVAKGENIYKENLENAVQYSVKGKKNFPVDWVIAQIEFKEGKEFLEKDELTYATLIFVRGEHKKITRMFCSRYKKH